MAKKKPLSDRIKLLKSGKCTACRKKKHAKGHTMCKPCKEKMRVRIAAYRARIKKEKR